MLDKKQKGLIKNLHADLPKGADMYLDKKIVSSVSDTVKYLSYIDLNNDEKIISVCNDEMDFIMRISDMPTFFARIFPGGERLFLIYDSKSKSAPREIEMNYPCRRLCHSKCYSLKEVQQPENLYVFPRFGKSPSKEIE